MWMQASKRSLQKDARGQLIPIIDILHLPFLCPALFSQPACRRNTSSTSRRRSRAELRHPRFTVAKHTGSHATAHRRTLASAAAVELDPRQDYHASWDPASYGGSDNLPPFGGQPRATIAPFDPQTSPIIIKDTLSTPPRTFRQKATNGISGNINEIHQTLHACLQVGRLERATTLLRKLNQLYKPEAPGLLAAHNDYVKELSYRVVQTSDLRLLQDLQRWFEVELRDVGVKPNEITYALMIQASLQARGTKKARMIRRYFSLAEKDGLSRETTDLLSAMEQVEVSEATSNAVYQPLEVVDRHTVDSMDESRDSVTAISRSPDDIPEIKEMLQKGQGLSTLKKSLSSFRSRPSKSSGIAQGTTAEREEFQRSLEKDTLMAAVERWRLDNAHLKSMGINTGLSNPAVGAMMWQWHEKLVSFIEEDIRRSHEYEQKEERTKSEEDFLLWSPYLQTLSAEKVSAATILATVAACSTDRMTEDSGPALHHVVSRIGLAVQEEYYSEAIKIHKGQADWRKILNLTQRSRRYGSIANVVQEALARSEDHLEWSGEMRIRLGAGLLSRLMDAAKVQVTRMDSATKAQVQDVQPVFFHTYHYVKGKRVGVVQLNSAILEQFVKKPVNSAFAKYLPMVTQPKPWAGYRDGGYLEHSVSVIRIDKNEDQARRYAIAASENGDMSQVFAGLDVLGSAAWKINRFVFDTMVSAWNTGEAFAKIPPEEPSGTPPTPPTSDSPLERAIFKRRQREFYNHKAAIKSQRCYQNFQLEVARSYLDVTFYIPHNIDFRGRAYPLAPFLNHMGADNCRGLLMFAQGKELKARGLWWLKVHLANVYGYDKASFEERIQFTEAHRQDIYDSANNPLGGSKWWLGAEDPWQCLAACNELKNALDSPDPTRYVCQLPIHQDGTCNGLQHYAALGGDISGAHQVNLEPGPRPSDIYTGVAEIVKARIAEDAAKGGNVAKLLDGKITRKIVKQTVMTNVYGVTFMGARMQVLRQLEDLYPDFPDTGAVNRPIASTYIAKEIFKALTNLFTGAHDIQYWLTDSAARICDSISPEQVAYLTRKAEGQQTPHQFKVSERKKLKDPIAAFKSTVIWTTPLKLPVVQSYREPNVRILNTNLQRISFRDKSTTNPVDKSKQVQAFPPNFIHSLDATHMFLTALKCHENGLTFASIHDSFWTHPGDVDTMNVIIREAFIRMHSEDIIGRLAAEFQTRYKGHMHLASVPLDSDIGRRIVAWRKDKQGAKLSSSVRRKLTTEKWDELVLEHRRLKLLASSDPKEREEGENMSTPGKIFRQFAAEETLAPTDVPTITLGGLTKSTSDPSSRSAKLKANEQLAVGDLGNAEPVAPAPFDVEEDVQSEKMAAGDGTEAAELKDSDVGDDTPELSEQPNMLEVKGKKRYTRTKKEAVWLWLPLTFAPVPKKANFDVGRVKNSQYFFS